MRCLKSFFPSPLQGNNAFTMEKKSMDISGPPLTWDFRSHQRHHHINLEDSDLNPQFDQNLLQFYFLSMEKKKGILYKFYL